MNQADLINWLYNYGYCRTKSEAEFLINALTEKIKKEICKGSEIKISGFGTFTRLKRKARPGFDPIRGKKISVPAQWVPKFRYSEKFKKELNK